LQKKFYLALAAIVLSLTGGSGMTIKDAQGNSLVFEGTIRRVVSISPAVTESVFLLGKGDLLVGVTQFCVRPAGALKIEKIGGVTDPNIEKIVSLKPDVVIVIDQFNILKSITVLKNYGVKVFVLGKRYDFDSIVNEFLLLGKLFGEEELSMKLAGDARKQIEELGRKIGARKDRPKVLWQIGVKPMFTPGKNTFPDNMIGLAGGINMTESFEGYREFSMEKAVELDPDIIISPAMGSLKDNVRIWEDYRSVSAVKNKKIFIIDENESSAPTIVTFVETVKKLFGYFYN
jgi:iron complex transport system substrate-binding protein